MSKFGYLLLAVIFIALVVTVIVLAVRKDPTPKPNPSPSRISVGYPGAGTPPSSAPPLPGNTVGGSPNTNVTPLSGNTVTPLSGNTVGGSPNTNVTPVVVDDPDWVHSYTAAPQDLYTHTTRITCEHLDEMRKTDPQSYPIFWSTGDTTKLSVLNGKLLTATRHNCPATSKIFDANLQATETSRNDSVSSAVVDPTETASNGSGSTAVVDPGYFMNLTWDQDMNSPWVTKHTKGAQNARCGDASKRGHDIEKFCVGSTDADKAFQAGCKAECPGYFMNLTWDQDMNSPWVKKHTKGAQNARCGDASKRGHDIEKFCVGSTDADKAFQAGCKYRECPGYFMNLTWDQDMNSPWVKKHTKGAQNARCGDASKRGHDIGKWCRGNTDADKAFQVGCKADCHRRGLF